MTVDTASGRHLPANPDKFEFDGEVASVFDNMAARSIPGYLLAQDLVSRLASPLLNPGSSVVDLGCSTGNFLRAIRNRAMTPDEIRFVGVDNSGPMLEQTMKACPWAETHGLDLLSFPASASDLKTRLAVERLDVVVIGWTLQFLPSFERRQQIIRAAHDALHPGGMLVVMEKYHLTEATVNETAQAAYLDFRVENGYTREEIAAKTQALRGAMWPASQDWTKRAMYGAGFNRVEILYRLFNFGGLVAFKDELP